MSLKGLVGGNLYVSLKWLVGGSLYVSLKWLVGGGGGGGLYVAEGVLGKLVSNTIISLKDLLEKAHAHLFFSSPVKIILLSCVYYQISQVTFQFSIHYMVLYLPPIEKGID